MSDSKEESKNNSGSRGLVVSSSSGAKNSGGHSSRLMILGIIGALLIILLIPLFFLYQMGVFSETNSQVPPVTETQENFTGGEIASDGMTPAGDLVPDDMTPAGDLVPADLRLSSEVYLANCVYDQSDSITCDTNCQGDITKNATAVIVDSNSTLAIAKETSQAIRLGTITFSQGKVSFSPEYVSLMGEVISHKLSELEQDTSQWAISLSCENPKGSGTAMGVSVI